jgi:hypothetical protein
VCNLRFLCQSASILLRGERKQSQYSCARPSLASPPLLLHSLPLLGLVVVWRGIPHGSGRGWRA